jgi:hypothetical protein
MHILEDWTDMQLEGFFKWAHWQPRGGGEEDARACLSDRGRLPGWPGSSVRRVGPATRDGLASLRMAVPSRAPLAARPRPCARPCRDLVSAMQAQHALGRLLLFDISHDRMEAEEDRILMVHQVRCVGVCFRGACVGGGGGGGGRRRASL